MLRHPEAWRNAGRFAEAVKRYPEAAPAAQFFLEEYIPAGQANRRRLLNTYFDKVFVFNLDSNLKAMFGALKPGIDFAGVERNGQTVLIDCRGETDPQLKLFKLLWIFSTIFEYVRLRGRRDTPLGLIIDEIASLGKHVTAGENPLADLLDDFINVYMHNHHIYFTYAHQSIYQVDEKLRNSLFSLGTYLFGRSATPQEARELGDLLWKKDPFRVKHYRKVWGSQAIMLGGRFAGSTHVVLDLEPQFMDLADQLEEAANWIKELGLFEFFLRPSLREGVVSSDVYKVNLASMVIDKATGELCFPNQDVVAGIRSLLEATVGTPIKTLLAEQDALLPSAAARTPVHQPPHRQTDSQIRHREHQQGDEAAPETSETAAAQPHTQPEPRHQRRHRLS